MDGGVINLDELIQQYNSSINNSNYRIHLLLNSDIKSLNSLMEKYQRLLDLKNQSIEIENEIQQLESRKNMSLSGSPTARVYGEKLETARNEKKELLDKISYLSSEQIKEMNRIKDSVRKKMDEFKKRFMSEENFNNIIDEISKIKDPIMEKRKNLESKRDEIKQKLEELYRNRAEFEKNISNADGYDKLSMCRDNVENETNILYYEQQLNSYDLQINECKYQEKKVDKLKKRYRKYFLVEENNLEFSDFVWHFAARIISYSLENISLFIEDIESFQRLYQEKFGRVRKKNSVLEDVENYDDIYLDAVEKANERQQEVDEANEDFDLMSRQSLNDEEEWKKAYTNVRPSDPSDNDQNYDDIYLDAVEKEKERQQEVDEANEDFDLTSRQSLNDEEEWKKAYADSVEKKKNGVDKHPEIKLNFRRLDEMEESNHSRKNSYEVFSNQVVAGMKDPNAGNAMLFGIDNFISGKEKKQDKEPGRISTMLNNASDVVRDKINNSSTIKKVSNVVTKIKEVPLHLKDKAKEKKPSSKNKNILKRAKNFVVDKNTERINRNKEDAVFKYNALVELSRSGQLSERYNSNPDYYDKLFKELSKYVSEDTFSAEDLNELLNSISDEKGRSK